MITDLRTLRKRYKELEEVASDSGAMNSDIQTIATVGLLAEIMATMHNEDTKTILREIARLQSAVKTLSNAVENLALSSTNNHIETMKEIKKIPDSLPPPYPL